MTIPTVGTRRLRLRMDGSLDKGLSLGLLAAEPVPFRTGTVLAHSGAGLHQGAGKEIESWLPWRGWGLT